MYFITSCGFSRKIRVGGAKGLRLPSILEETCVLDKYLGIFVDYTFFMRKVVQETLGSSKK